nr:translation initiation factor IF-2-like [Equus asinus]
MAEPVPGRGPRHPGLRPPLQAAETRSGRLLPAWRRPRPPPSRRGPAWPVRPPRPRPRARSAPPRPSLAPAPPRRAPPRRPPGPRPPPHSSPTPPPLPASAWGPAPPYQAEPRDQSIPASWPWARGLTLKLAPGAQAPAAPRSPTFGPARPNEGRRVEEALQYRYPVSREPGGGELTLGAGATWETPGGGLLRPAFLPSRCGGALRKARRTLTSSKVRERGDKDGAQWLPEPLLPLGNREGEVGKKLLEGFSRMTREPGDLQNGLGPSSREPPCDVRPFHQPYVRTTQPGAWPWEDGQRKARPIRKMSGAPAPLTASWGHPTDHGGSCGWRHREHSQEEGQPPHPVVWWTCVAVLCVVC